MTTTSLAAFMEALQQIMKSGIAAIVFKESDLFAQANRDIPRAERISYTNYLAFVAMLDEHSETYPDVQDALAYLDIYEYLRSELFDQEKKLVDDMLSGTMDWRRGQWLVDKRARDERARIMAIKARVKDMKNAALTPEETEKAMAVCKKLKFDWIARSEAPTPASTPPQGHIPPRPNTPPTRTQPKKKFSERFSPKTRAVG